MPCIYKKKMKEKLLLSIIKLTYVPSKMIGSLKIVHLIRQQSL